MRKLLLLLALLLVSCAQPTSTPDQRGDDNQMVARAYREHRDHFEATIHGDVVRVLPDGNGEHGPHQRFLVRIDEGQTILVAHNLTLAGRLPLHRGQPVEAHGEFIWSERGGVLHYTHHDPRGHHAPGWVTVEGRRYD